MSRPQESTFPNSTTKGYAFSRWINNNYMNSQGWISLDVFTLGISVRRQILACVANNIKESEKPETFSFFVKTLQQKVHISTATRLKIEMVNETQNRVSELRDDEIIGSYSKRIGLVHCIRHIYRLYNRRMPMPSNSITSSRLQTRYVLDKVMTLPSLTRRKAAKERIKRRLIFDGKIAGRKTCPPKRRTTEWTEVAFHKRTRPLGVVMRRRRNFLKCHQKQSNPHEFSESFSIDGEISTSSCPLVASMPPQDQNGESRKLTLPDQGVIDRCQPRCGRARRYSSTTSDSHSSVEQSEPEFNTKAYQTKKLQEAVLQKQYHERSVANAKILEASVRSVLYLEALVDLMAKQDREISQKFKGKLV
uniref:Uncharacterized protein n=1 Tax=Glossina palpalis gambiensis TaxID=67801 RepID=A0A1B0AS98_9MUSC